MLVQVQQGIGLGTTKPIFNRQHVSLTRFQPLGKIDGKSKAIPGSVVVHAGFGCCVGDQPPYDLFAMGGPLSVSFLFLVQRLARKNVGATYLCRTDGSRSHC
jgi:hypothetical protein